MSVVDDKKPVAVIGAGTMGAGIAQVAAAHGHPVYLYDVASDAATKAKARMSGQLDKRVARGKMAQSDADSLLERIHPVAELSALGDAAVVIEAIVENLEIKRSLFADLEAVLAPDAILATNTSSISVTSIANGLNEPGRVVGMHFFNPAPVMKLVEVISGRTTAPEVAETVFELAQSWGKVAVHARSTPGFIVNRVARPFYAEALRLYEEQVSDPATLDALLTQGGGFRMGPFELMDLIGHDVNYAVSVSVFDAFYQDPRFRPSLVQLELVNAGHLGRKSGHGFYSYGEGMEKLAPRTESISQAAEPFDGFEPGRAVTVDGVRFALTDGRMACDVARRSGSSVVLYDLLNTDASGSRVGFAASPDVPDESIDRFIKTLAGMGIDSVRLPDWPGLVVMRTVAMLANEGFEATMQGVASEADVDAAMRYGLNYPRGPMEWARDIGLERILSVLNALHGLTGDPRYRASLGLRMAASDVN